MAESVSNGVGSLFWACCGLCFKGVCYDEPLYQDWSHNPASQKYQILHSLGAGAFSEVLLAQELAPRGGRPPRQVALKVLFLKRPGLSVEQVRILSGEGRLLRMLDHPGIVRCLEVLSSRGQLVLALEHLEGGELLEGVRELHAYSEAAAALIFRQVMEAVRYLHALGIMHRDLKPENLLFKRPPTECAARGVAPQVKLIDFGMAGVVRSGRATRGCLGSPGFIAPEVIRGESHTTAMDIYSCGVLLFVLLTGRKPWDDACVDSLDYAGALVAEAPGLRDARFAAVSPAARSLVVSMLADAPQQRPGAQAVLAHPWLARAEDGAHSRPIAQAVQLRLGRLMDARRQHGSAAGMLVCPRGMGTRAAALEFHSAVQAARQRARTQALHNSGGMLSRQLAIGSNPSALVAATGNAQHPPRLELAEPGAGGTGTAGALPAVHARAFSTASAAAGGKPAAPIPALPQRAPDALGWADLYRGISMPDPIHAVLAGLRNAPRALSVSPTTLHLLEAVAAQSSVGSREDADGLIASIARQLTAEEASLASSLLDAAHMAPGMAADRAVTGMRASAPRMLPLPIAQVCEPMRCSRSTSLTLACSPSTMGLDQTPLLDAGTEGSCGELSSGMSGADAAASARHPALTPHVQRLLGKVPLSPARSLSADRVECGRASSCAAEETGSAAAAIAAGAASSCGDSSSGGSGGALADGGCDQEEDDSAVLPSALGALGMRTSMMRPRQRPVLSAMLTNLTPCDSIQPTWSTDDADTDGAAETGTCQGVWESLVAAADAGECGGCFAFEGLSGVGHMTAASTSGMHSQEGQQQQQQQQQQQKQQLQQQEGHDGEGAQECGPSRTAMGSAHNSLRVREPGNAAAPGTQARVSSVINIQQSD